MLARFLAGECSEAEAALVRRALMARPELARTLERFLARLDGEHELPPRPDVEESWSALAGRIRAEPRSAPPRPATHRAPRQRFTILTPKRRRAWWRSAWPALVAAAGVMAFVALRGGHATQQPPAPASRSWTTTAGQRAEISLTDGTKITLAPGSRLRVSADFGEERRDLYLEGLAFFDVAHDTTRPFTVYAGNASAHDLGTAFAVRSFAADSAVQIVVREGVVAMSGVGPLAAGDVGVLASDGTTRITHRADLDAMLGWLDGRLAFEDAPLARVVDDLRRWHGADIVIADSTIATLPFTGEMNGLSVRPAVNLLAATLGLRVTREGERWLLSTDPHRTPKHTRTAGFHPRRR